MELPAFVRSSSFLRSSAFQGLRVGLEELVFPFVFSDSTRRWRHHTSYGRFSRSIVTSERPIYCLVWHGPTFTLSKIDDQVACPVLKIAVRAQRWFPEDYRGVLRAFSRELGRLRRICLISGCIPLRWVCRNRAVNGATEIHYHLLEPRCLRTPGVVLCELSKSKSKSQETHRNC
jgi:hypothetical protein